VSGPDFVPLSGSDHAVSIARSVNASSSHGRPAGCRAPRPQRRPGWPPDRCSNGQAVHVSGAHRPLPPGGSRASCRSRDTSRTVRAPLPTTRPPAVATGPPLRSLSAAHPRRASPCRGPLRRVHRARSARPCRGWEQNPDITNRDYKLLLKSRLGRDRTAGQGVHGPRSRFVVAGDLRKLVAGMNRLTSEPLLD
jgi:hypothetical protein